MNDCISRHAAIDSLRAMQTYKLFAGDDQLLIDQAGAQTELMMLPPAQPEQRWIPCSERMPESLQEVLVTSTHGHVYTSRIVHGDFEYGGNVLAWMPLPEPYKGGEKS